MGVEKLLLRIGERTMLERAIAAAQGFPTVLVASPALVERICAAADLHIVVNAAPERGMSHSLQLANAAIGDADSALAVLLADTPLVDAALVRRVTAARGDADVAYPVCKDRPGHPVVFGPRARAAIGGLAAGDTIRRLRDAARWRRVELNVEDDAALIDVDTPQALARVRRLLETPGALG